MMSDCQLTLIRIIKLKWDYNFHNNAAFMQIKLGLQEEDVEELKGVS